MRRTCKPHADERGCGAIGADTPRDRLTERPCAHPMPPKPAIPVPVGEGAAAGHGARVCARCLLKPHADPEWRRAVGRARLVDRQQQALLLRAERLELGQLRRRRARRPSERDERERQNEECAAPPNHERAFLPDESAGCSPKRGICVSTTTPISQFAQEQSLQALQTPPTAEIRSAIRPATRRRRPLPPLARTSP